MRTPQYRLRDASRFGPGADRKEVIEAAKKARCYDFIMVLPDGFETVIGEGGETLSGGEKQRISITELCRGKTLLVIAQRLNTIRHADKILVISGGRVTQSGNHERLMKEDGIYRNFVTVRESSQRWNSKRKVTSSESCA